jgi:hypothetical protein
MKSITFKKYIWVHSILSFVSLYSLIIKYEIKDLYYEDTYRLTNSDRLTFIPIFLFLSFATTWLYYYFSRKKDFVIAPITKPSGLIPSLIKNHIPKDSSHVMG